MLSALALYVALGACVGILAGMLGVGGGLIIVPVLAAMLSAQQMPAEIIMHMALGTSLASILLTSISSVYSHHRRGAVSWPDAIRLTPGILIGAWCGGVIADHLSSDILKPVFAIFELCVAAYMLYGHKVKPHDSSPGITQFALSGGVIGSISSLVGIGGGTMTVPWLMWHGSSIHRAIATSAAVGFPIAVAGALSYLVNGWDHAALPPWTLGYIYLPALVGIVISSVLFAPLGARWAHQLDTVKLKKIFAFLLIALATYLLAV